ncbi:adenylyl-sulfate kinase [Roseibacillus persicicus]|uniref:Adenylyl-sulfate kinase n=1 Tax=Roseibacillus persicicus TaxID=454148 RepID=A0A918WR20_9BACT|nr:adenylyl-sulfate kinase [Roseibacillus persicicus]GHC66281.1 adenylyl-sulfate kinase [Roseibacillus persicicus]
MAENIHPDFERFVSRKGKEKLLGQNGIVLWLYGMSGSGKSTIATEVEKQLAAQGRFTVVLDGDNLRSGLNADLGFTNEARNENVRRTAEVAKLFASQGVITLISVITPLRRFREMARGIVGEDFREIYVKADFETCARRDPKGLYAKVADGKVANFTGKDSSFEEPEEAELILDTQKLSPTQSATEVLSLISGLSK